MISISSATKDPIIRIGLRIFTGSTCPYLWVSTVCSTMRPGEFELYPVLPSPKSENPQMMWTPPAVPVKQFIVPWNFTRNYIPQAPSVPHSIVGKPLPLVILFENSRM